MSVYIEYVVIDNLVVTAIIAVISCRLLKIRAERFRVAAASLTGTIAAVIYPLLKIDALWLFFLKIALWYLLSLIVFYKKTKILRGAAAFLTVTACFGGVIFLIGFMITGDLTAALTTPAFNFSFGLIILLPVLLYFAAKRLIKNVNKLRNLKSCSFNFELTVLEKTVSGLGFLDTGNLLTDEKTGLPVIIAGDALSAKITDGKEICGGYYINYNSLKGGGSILILPVKNFLLYSQSGQNIIKEVMLGISSTRFNGFDALLPNAVL